MVVLPLGSCVSNNCMKLLFETAEMSIAVLPWGDISALQRGRRIPSAQDHSCADQGGGSTLRENKFEETPKESPMDFTMSAKQQEWLERVRSFMTKHVRPAVPIYKQQDAEGSRWKVIPILEDLKAK